MIIKLLRELLQVNSVLAEDRTMDAEHEPAWDELRLAGLDEEELRRMDPDDRVAVLEQARLDPYDYIYLAC